MEQVYLLDPDHARYLTDAHLQRVPDRLTQTQIAVWRADAIVQRANTNIQRRAERPTALLRWMMLVFGVAAAAWWVNNSYYRVVLPCAACWAAALPLLLRARTLRGSLPFNQLIILLLGAVAGVLMGRLLSVTPQYRSLWAACGSLICLLPPALITLRWIFAVPSQIDLTLYPPADPALSSVVITPLVEANLSGGKALLTCRIDLPDGQQQTVTAEPDAPTRLPAVGTPVAVQITRLIEQPDGSWRAEAMML